MKAILWFPATPATVMILALGYRKARPHRIEAIRSDFKLAGQRLRLPLTRQSPKTISLGERPRDGWAL